MNTNMDDRLVSEVSNSERSQHQRPFGVTVIAIVLVVNAVVAAIRMGAEGAAIRSVVEQLDYLQLINPVFGLAGLLIAIGLWRLDRWAWVTTMLWAGLNMVTSLFAYYNGHEHFVSMALSVIAVFYLNQRDVQVAFLGQSLRQEPPDE